MIKLKQLRKLHFQIGCKSPDLKIDLKQYKEVHISVSYNVFTFMHGINIELVRKNTFLFNSSVSTIHCSCTKRNMNLIDWLINNLTSEMISTGTTISITRQ